MTGVDILVGLLAIESLLILWLAGELRAARRKSSSPPPSSTDGFLAVAS